MQYFLISSTSGPLYDGGRYLSEMSPNSMELIISLRQSPLDTPIGYVYQYISLFVILLESSVLACNFFIETTSTHDLVRAARGAFNHIAHAWAGVFVDGCLCLETQTRDCVMAISCVFNKVMALQVV